MGYMPISRKGAQLPSAILQRTGVRHRAKQLAAVGDELGADREAGSSEATKQHHSRDLF